MTVPERHAPRVRWAVGGIFFLVGFGIATWFTGIPRFRDRLDLSPGVLAVALMAPTVGALVAMQIVGPLTTRVGSRLVARVSSVLLPVALIGVAFVDNVWQATAVLLLFGAFDGCLDVAANTQGIALERLLGRPVLNGLHGAWGVGAILGGATSSAVIALNVSMTWHLTFVAAVLVPLGWWCGRNLLAEPQVSSADADVSEDGGKGPEPRRGGFAAWKAGWTPWLLVLGGIGAAGMLAEGAISNWIGVYLLEHKAAAASLAALAYTVFTLTETLARFAGDRVNERIGAVRLLRAGALLFAIGLAITLLSPNVWLSIGGLVLTGIGIAPINPVAFSAVGHRGEETGTAGTAIGHYTTLSYGGVLGGPALIGGIAQVVGLPIALAFTLLPIALIAGGARAAGHVSYRRSEAPTG
jgi:MFS family permease